MLMTFIPVAAYAEGIASPNSTKNDGTIECDFMITLSDLFRKIYVLSNLVNFCLWALNFSGTDGDTNIKTNKSLVCGRYFFLLIYGERLRISCLES